MGEQKEPTKYQKEWDERNARYNRNLYIALGVWMVLNIGSFAWVIVNQTIPSFAVKLEGGDTRAAGVDPFGGVGSLFIVVLVSALLAIPLKKVARNVGWVMGSRPTDDYKPREVRPVKIDWEQLDDDLRIARIGKYTFNVKRFQYPSILNRFRKPRYSYEITNREGDVTLHSTLDSSLFRGMDEAEVHRVIHDHIVCTIEDRTDHFKELNYSI